MKKPATVRFTEEMHGAVGFGAADHRQGWEQGIASTCPFMFHLTISVDDLHRWTRARSACGSRSPPRIRGEKGSGS